jgi:hypothetical protein
MTPGQQIKKFNPVPNPLFLTATAAYLCDLDQKMAHLEIP